MRYRMQRCPGRCEYHVHQVSALASLTGPQFTKEGYHVVSSALYLLKLGTLPSCCLRRYRRQVRYIAHELGFQNSLSHLQSCVFILTVLQR